MLQAQRMTMRQIQWRTRSDYYRNVRSVYSLLGGSLFLRAHCFRYHYIRFTTYACRHTKFDRTQLPLLLFLFHHFRTLHVLFAQQNAGYQHWDNETITHLLRGP